MTAADLDAPVELHQYVGGRWMPGAGAELRRFNPARPDELVAHGDSATADDLDAAVAAASAAARAWSRVPIAERGAYLLRAAADLESRAEALARELAREEGKAIVEARGEIARAVQVLRYHGTEGDRESGELYASPRAGERILVTRRPLGVVGVITPFNFPIAIPAWKIAPALVHGNTVVWKPASAVPLLAVRLTEALAGAGLPDGVLNLVIGPGQLGTRLAEHPGLDGLTFTGSTAVGRDLAVRLASAGTPYQAELGGKNASIVLADADLELATDQVLSGAFRGTGQRCTATSRLLVEASVADDLLERLAARSSTLAVGDPLDEATYVGPLVDDRAHARVGDAIATARASGLREHGARTDAFAAGYFVSPAIFEVDDAASELWTTELFGPVLSVQRVADAADAFARADDSDYGLSGAVFTRDLGRALAAIDDVRIGVLHVNSESAGADPHVPFGGVKHSSYGPKEQGRAAREFFTETTTVYLRG